MKSNRRDRLSTVGKMVAVTLVTAGKIAWMATKLLARTSLKVLSVVNSVAFLLMSAMFAVAVALALRTLSVERDDEGTVRIKANIDDLDGDLPDPAAGPLDEWDDSDDDEEEPTDDEERDEVEVQTPGSDD